MPSIESWMAKQIYAIKKGLLVHGLHDPSWLTLTYDKVHSRYYIFYRHIEKHIVVVECNIFYVLVPICPAMCRAANCSYSSRWRGNPAKEIGFVHHLLPEDHDT